MRKICIMILCASVFSSCSETSDKEKMAQAEKECAQKTKIDGLTISFFGYFPNEADSINVKIKRDNKIIEDFNDKIPIVITDSLRHRREYSLKKEILLTDTVILKIKNETEKKAYNFKYRVRPHYNMISSGFGCDYYEVTVNNKKIDGGVVDFMKQGFDMSKITREKFKEYYKN